MPTRNYWNAKEKNFMCKIALNELKNVVLFSKLTRDLLTDLGANKNVSEPILRKFLQINKLSRENIPSVEHICGERLSQEIDDILNNTNKEIDTLLYALF